MARSKCATAAVSCALMAGTASAGLNSSGGTVNWSRDPQTQFLIVTVSATGTQTGTTVTLETTNQGAPLGGERIGSVSVTANGSQAGDHVRLIIREGDPNSLQGVSNVRKVGGSAELWIQTIETRGTITGIIEANRVISLNARADIFADITATGSASPLDTISSVVAGYTGDPGSIRGNVTCHEGSIGEIRADQGTIGPRTNGLPVQILNETASGGDIGTIRARAITADIRMGTGGNNGRFGFLEATQGNFTGSLLTKAFKVDTSDAVVVRGNLDADITIASSNPDAALTRGIKIGGSLVSGRTIDIGAAQGLVNEILINRANTGGVWGGQVRIAGVGPTNPPFYVEPHSAIGGGAVGLVPFRKHETSCFPADGTWVNLMGIAINSITEEPVCVEREFVHEVRVVHYGPVRWEAISGIPLVRVFRNNVEETAQFVSVADSGSTDTLARRTVSIDRASGDWALGYYRFELGATAAYPTNPATSLVSDDVLTGVTAFVPQWQHHMRLYRDCDEAMKKWYETNGDGMLNMGDAAMWLVEPVDFNENGAANLHDFGMLLNAIILHGN